MVIISKHSALSSTRQDVFLILTASAAVPPRTQSAAQLPSLAPHDSKARLLSGRDSQGFMAKPCTPHLITRKGYATSVRQQSCQRLCNAQRVQSFKLQTHNVRGQGARPLAFSWGSKGAILSRERMAPFPVQRQRRCHPSARRAEKRAEAFTPRQPPHAL